MTNGSETFLKCSKFYNHTNCCRCGSYYHFDHWHSGFYCWIHHNYSWSQIFLPLCISWDSSHLLVSSHLLCSLVSIFLRCERAIFHKYWVIRKKIAGQNFLGWQILFAFTFINLTWLAKLVRVQDFYIKILQGQRSAVPISWVPA